MKRADTALLAPLSNRSAAAILVVAFVFRLAMIGLLDVSFTVGDAASYRVAAHNLVASHVFSFDEGAPPAPGAYRPPLFPAFLAALMLLSDSTRFFQLAQILLSLGTALLVAGAVAPFAPRAGRWTLWLAAVSPFEAAYAVVGLSEALTAFLLAGAAVALVRLSGWRRPVLGGFLAGLCVLCRDVYLPLVPLVALAFGLGLRSSADRLKAPALFLLTAILTVAPWTLRNVSVLGKPIPVSAGRLGYSLWLGTWATNGDFTRGDAAGERRTYPSQAYRSADDEAAVLAAEKPPIDWAVADPAFRSLALARLRDEPLSVAGTWLRRWPRLWLGTRFDIFTLNHSIFPYGSPTWRLAKAALWAVNALFLSLGFLGFLLALRRRSALGWLFVPVAFTALVYLPLNSFENRYSQPVYPLVLCFAGFFIAEAIDWVARRRTSRQGALA